MPIAAADMPKCQETWHRPVPHLTFLQAYPAARRKKRVSLQPVAGQGLGQ